MKAIYLVFIIAVCLLFGVSCKQNDIDLIHTVSEDFSVPISCISSDQENDSILFAGLENGDIVRVNFRTGERKVMSTAFDRRIYDIVQENDTTLWLGVRNNGLVKCLYKNDSIQDTTVYKISVKGYYNDEPTSNYAPYDIEMDKDGTLFLGTSSGVYCLPKQERDSTLTAVYRPDGHESFHFGVNQVKICGDSLFCATDSGLVVLSKSERNNSKQYHFISKKKFSHLYFDKKDDVLYATADSIKYKINTKDSTNILCSNVGKNLFAYVTDTHPDKGKWEFTATQINYSNLNGKIVFTLPERMNPSYRNYLHLGKNFLFFTQGKKLYSLALHQNPIGKTNHIIAAHTNNSICYFITNDNYLYKYEKEKEPEVLGFIGNFDDGENIIQMCSSSDNYLWFITDKEHLYKINLNPFLLKKTPFVRTYNAEIDPLKDDFKSLFYDKNNLYVGSRYLLYQIHNPENIKGKENNERHTDTLDITTIENDLYAMHIYIYGNDIYIASLNHGLIKVKNKPLIETGNNDTTFQTEKGGKNIKRLVALPAGLIVIDTTTDKTNGDYKLISSLFYSKNENQYAIGYKGIGEIKGQSSQINIPFNHLDISFNKAAVTNSIYDEVEDKIILGSQTGLYEYHNGNLTSISIPNKPLFSFIEWVILIVVLLLLTWIIFFFYAPFKMKQFNKKLTRDDKKIMDVLKIEDRKLLSEGTEGLYKIKEGFKKVYSDKKIQKRFRPVRNIIIVNNLNKRLKKLETKIEETQITREKVIKWNKDLIDNWKKKFENRKKELITSAKLEDIKSDEEIDTITSSQTELGKLIGIFICQIQECESEKTNLESEKQKQLTKLQNEIEKLNAVVSTCETEKTHTKDEILTCISKLEEYIKKFEYIFDKKEQQSIISEEIDCDNSLETKLQNLINLYINVTEKYVPKTKFEEDLKEIEILVNEGSSYEDLEKKLNNFIKDNEDTPFSKLPFGYQRNTRGFVAILCCTALKNKQIKEALNLSTATSLYFKDILQAINNLKLDKEKSHPLIDKLKKGIENRQRQQENTKPAEN